MGFFVNSLQLLERGVGVDLCSLQAFVPQEFLYTFQSRLVVQHGSGKAVSQYVW